MRSPNLTSVPCTTNLIVGPEYWGKIRAKHFFLNSYTSTWPRALLSWSMFGVIVLEFRAQNMFIIYWHMSQRKKMLINTKCIKSLFNWQIKGDFFRNTVLMPQVTHWNRHKGLRTPLCAFFRRENCLETFVVDASILIMWPYTSHVCTFSQVDMADSSSSENSSISGSEYSDFEVSMEGEHIERVYEPVGEIRPSRFQPSGRTWNRVRYSKEDHWSVQRGRLNQESENGECIYTCK